jgi:hypothetical protein
MPWAKALRLNAIASLSDWMAFAFCLNVPKFCLSIAFSILAAAEIPSHVELQPKSRMMARRIRLQGSF